MGALLLVGILLFFHESGHFLFAKLFGVKVPVYSFGMGRRLFGFEYKGTDYRVSLLPFGGYVRMEGLDPNDPTSDPDSPENLMNKPVWQRLLIHGAGPAGNMLLPVGVFTALYMAGEPQVSAVIGQTMRGSPADVAGLEVGDRLVEVNGRHVVLWEDLYDAFGGVGAGNTAQVVVQRDGRSLTIQVPLPADLNVVEGVAPLSPIGIDYAWQDSTVGVDDPGSPAWKGGLRSFDQLTRVGDVPVESYQDLLEQLDLAAGADRPVPVAYRRVEGRAVVEGEAVLTPDPGWSSSERPVADPLSNRWGLYPGSVFVHELVADSAAVEAGIQVGDRVYAVDGHALSSWWELVDRIGAAQEGEGPEATARALEVVLVRDGQVMTMSLTPRIVRDTDATGRYQHRALVGIGKGGGSVAPFRDRRYHSFSSALSRAVDETIGVAGLIVERLGELFTGEAAVSQSLGGPIQIFRDAGAAAKEGIFTWARMMALLSISVGIVNLVPVPALDGGRILFDLVEGVRGRRLPPQVEERAMQVGVLLIVGLFIMVSIFDVGRLLDSMGLVGR